MRLPRPAILVRPRLLVPLLPGQLSMGAARGWTAVAAFGPRPVVRADWRGGVAVSGVTVSRASPGTAILSGALVEFGSNTQRVGDTGLLIEPAATNLLTNPRTVGALGWTNALITSLAVPALNGIADQAAQLTDNVGAGAKFTRQTVGIAYTSGLTYRFQVIARAGTHGIVQLVYSAAAFGTTRFQNFDLANGVLGTGGPDNTAQGMIPLGGGNYLCFVESVATASVTAEFSTISMVSAFNSPRGQTYVGTGSTIIVQFPMISAGAGETSLVLPPTETPGSATRAAETATLFVPGADRTVRLLRQDLNGFEWSNANVVSNAVTFTPRAGQNAVRVARAWELGALSPAQETNLGVAA